MTKSRSTSRAPTLGSALILCVGAAACNTTTPDDPVEWTDDPVAPFAPERCQALHHTEVVTLTGDEQPLKEHVALVATDGRAALFFSAREWDGESGARTAGLYKAAFPAFGEPGLSPGAIEPPHELSPIGGRSAAPFRGTDGVIDVLYPRIDTLGEDDLEYAESHRSGEWRLAALPGADASELPEEQTDLSALAREGRPGFVLAHRAGRVVSLVDTTSGRLVLGNVTAGGALQRLGDVGCEIPFDGADWTPAQIDAVQVGEGAIIAYACAYSGGEMGLAIIDGELALHDLGKPRELDGHVQPRLIVKPGAEAVWLLTRSASALRSSVFVTPLSPRGEIQAPPVEVDRVVTYRFNSRRITAQAFAGGLALVTVPHDALGLRVSVRREGFLPPLELTVPTEGEVEVADALASPDGTQLLLAWTDQRRAEGGTYTGSHVNVTRITCSQ